MSLKSRVFRFWRQIVRAPKKLNSSTYNLYEAVYDDVCAVSPSAYSFSESCELSHACRPALRQASAKWSHRRIAPHSAPINILISWHLKKKSSASLLKQKAESAPSSGIKNSLSCFMFYFTKSRKFVYKNAKIRYPFLLLEMKTILNPMDYVRHGEIQGHSLVFFRAHWPCILPCLT